ncbi:MAG: 6,7-dimethyl-8-ribityllumazine synthase [Rhodospirillales bacterium]|nr:6,7-dimethyl-8-ribityllumazine synthase [Rhodospirillales bacterium]MDE1882880.1 6,7-dimethyl-8-ribityllumazine synthase [Rhodospirillales bacterium]MDE2391040.1 6,7-dimethyl-8-ribityllumazine synthase [Rhodospirillales bacterium]MDE2459172.1 6,7-dimethyl-8-ribityllumazine synthase [Rhodospirillales bacterium]
MSTADAPLPEAPKVSGAPPKILAISAPYYRNVVDGMLDAARDIFFQANASLEVIEIAGAFELPQALAIAASAQPAFDGFIALGCVVRGETDHYEFVCTAAMDGLMRVAVEKRLCLGTGLLTVDTLAQAQARSRETGANKGAEAAVACLKQIILKRRFMS